MLFVMIYYFDIYFNVNLNGGMGCNIIMCDGFRCSILEWGDVEDVLDCIGLWIILI